ncbi:hypothetical protein [Streptomyces sp. NPDC055140]
MGLLLAGAVVPALASRISGRVERQQSPARGELATCVVDTFTATAGLIVAGALPTRLAMVRAADVRLTGLATRSAAAAALSAGLIPLITGLTVTGSAALGIQGVAGGALPGVCLAVVVLTPLAAFEAVAGMPTAAQFRERARVARARLDEVLADFPVLIMDEPAEHLDLPTADALTADLLAVTEGRTTLVDRQGGRLRDLCLRERQAGALVAAGDGASGPVAPIDQPA